MNLKSKGTELTKVPISSSKDVVTSRFKGKSHAEAIGFTGRDIIRITTATSELARNIVQHAKAPGQITFFEIKQDGRLGLGILAEDKGVGMKDSKSVMQQAGSIMSGGLYGSKRLSNEFEIDSGTGRGTKVQLIRWLS